MAVHTFPKNEKRRNDYKFKPITLHNQQSTLKDNDHRLQKNKKNEEKNKENLMKMSTRSTCKPMQFYYRNCSIWYLKRAAKQTKNSHHTAHSWSIWIYNVVISSINSNSKFEKGKSQCTSYNITNGWKNGNSCFKRNKKKSFHFLMNIETLSFSRYLSVNG